MERTALLTFSHVTVAYGDKDVLKDVSFSLEEGETLAVAGASGSGKSTLLKAITGLLGENGYIPKGDIYFRGRNLIDMAGEEKRKILGREIAVIRQDTGASLCPIRTLGSQIEEYAEQHGEKGSDAYAMAEPVMKKIGLTESRRIWDSFPFELSGGMNQRMGLVMAGLLHPSLILADEPTSALDVLSQQQVLEEMNLLREKGTALILVTHNLKAAEKLCEKIMIVKDGKMQETGYTKEVFSHPRSSYTKKLLDSMISMEV